MLNAKSERYDQPSRYSWQRHVGAISLQPVTPHSHTLTRIHKGEFSGMLVEKQNYQITFTRRIAFSRR